MCPERTATRDDRPRANAARPCAAAIGAQFPEAAHSLQPSHAVVRIGNFDACHEIRVHRRDAPQPANTLRFKLLRLCA
jgi:hypothetical protein